MWYYIRERLILTQMLVMGFFLFNMNMTSAFLLLECHNFLGQTFHGFARGEQAVLSLYCSPPLAGELKLN